MMTEEEDQPVIPAPSQVVITFPNGVSTTKAELQLSNVDTVQVEIAANFLQRVASDQYRAAKMQSLPKPGPGIVAAPPGFRV